MQIAKLFFIIITGAALLGGCGGSPAAKDTINAKDNDGYTPLHSAVRDNNAAEAKRLIDNGADVNARDNFDGTPLHHIADVEVAKLLIDNGADVNAKGRYGHTLLHHITTWATRYSNAVEIAKLLIDNGADVNARDEDGRTPLRETRGNTYANPVIRKLLIDNGATY